MILFLKPYFSSRPWHGTRLTKIYNCPQDTGEAWVCSGLKGKSSIIMNGEFLGMTLDEVFRLHKKDLFNMEEEVEFPLLLKVIDASSDLSVQVHPDDEYAKLHHAGRGKFECWYFLPDNTADNVVVGLDISTKEDLRRVINAHEVMNVLCLKKLENCDYLKINPGTVHALKGGSFVLETQQPSDITYRLYDYDRKPERELHIEDSLNVIDFNASPVVKSFKNGGVDENKYFKFENIIVNNSLIKNIAGVAVVFIISGNGQINGNSVKPYDTLLVLKEQALEIGGNLNIAIATPNVTSSDKHYFLGIDGGGTKTKFTVINENKEIVYTSIAGPSSIDTVPVAETKKVLVDEANKIPYKIDSVFAGLGGVISNDDIMLINSILRDITVLKPNAFVSSNNDAVNALYGGLGGDDGIIIIAGTGSVAYGKCRGFVHRCGGYCYQEGDPGSAYDLGIKALRHLARVCDGRLEKDELAQKIMNEINVYDQVNLVKYMVSASRTEVASLAKVVTSVNTSVSKQIITSSADEMFLMIKTVYEKLKFSGNVKFTIIGSLGNAETYYKEYLLNRIHNELPLIIYQKNQDTPDVGAALKALEEFIKLK